MTESQKLIELIELLGIPREVAEDLVRYFHQIDTEFRMADLEKSSVGKFVETLVQASQSLDPQREGYDESVSRVDDNLRKLETKALNGIPNESRVALLRVARSIYCLRNKRSMVHKNNIDPNLYDLEFALQSAKWVMTELVRLATDRPMEEAGLLIEDIQRPRYPFIERVMGRSLVLIPGLSTREELLLVMFDSHSWSGSLSLQEIYEALDRRTKSAVYNALRRLREARLVEGGAGQGYVLTRTGLEEAIRVIRKITKEAKDR